MMEFDAIICALYNNWGRIYRRNTLYSVMYLALHSKMKWIRNYYMPVNTDIEDAIHAAIHHNHVMEGNLFGRQPDLFFYDLTDEGIVHHDSVAHDCESMRRVLGAGRRICGLRPEPMQAATLLHYSETAPLEEKYSGKDIRLARLLIDSLFGECKE